jgi:hypothetical protein
VAAVNVWNDDPEDEAGRSSKKTEGSCPRSHFQYTS